MRSISIVLLIVSSFLFYACSDSLKTKRKGVPNIEFEKLSHDFGNLEFGGDGSCKFVFENTGSGPLILTNVKSTCGCTVPEWPHKPIEEGAIDTITVRYDTHRIGSFTKSITVYSNAENSPVRLLIKGRVKPLEDDAV